MAGFDSFLSKAKELGELATKKTSEVVDSTKYKLDLSNAKKQLQAKYTQLGESYYNAVKSSVEPDFTEIILEIDSCLAKVNEIEDKINEMQGIKKCPACGTVAVEGSEYCQNCGYKL